MTNQDLETGPDLAALEDEAAALQFGQQLLQRRRHLLAEGGTGTGCAVNGVSRCGNAAGAPSSSSQPSSTCYRF